MVCYTGALDTVHVMLDDEQGNLGQKHRHTHLDRIKAVQKPNDESKRIWSKYSKSDLQWGPLSVGDGGHVVSGRSS